MAAPAVAAADELVVELADDEADETQDELVFMAGTVTAVPAAPAAFEAKFELDIFTRVEVKFELDDLAEPFDAGVLLLCSMPLVEADERRRLDDESLLLPILFSLFMGASIWS